MNSIDKRCKRCNTHRVERIASIRSMDNRCRPSRRPASKICGIGIECGHIIRGIYTIAKRAGVTPNAPVLERKLGIIGGIAKSVVAFLPPERCPCNSI